MKDYRVTSGWVHYGNNDTAYEDTRTMSDKLKDDHKRRVAIGNTAKLDVAKLKKESETELAKKSAERTFLLEGYSQKKLKSVDLIEKAQKMFKRKGDK